MKKEYYSYDELPAVLSMDELRTLLQISRNTAYALVRSGKIPSIRAGRQFRIPKTAVLDYLSCK
ncbi:MAG: helix-turn-helix domain-containing protein [Ruminococcaceae bacterium]|nr:helix-turn-helix domain-containing protein [Oscillospiraceae bacterium]